MLHVRLKIDLRAAAVIVAAAAVEDKISKKFSSPEPRLKKTALHLRGCYHISMKRIFLIGPLLFALVVVTLTLLQYDFLRGLGWDPINAPTFDWPSGLALGPYGIVMTLTGASGSVIRFFARTKSVAFASAACAVSMTLSRAGRSAYASSSAAWIAFCF